MTNDINVFFEGHWEKMSYKDIERYKTINKDDWALARLNEKTYKYEIAIEAIAKQEEKYLKEWIEYHINLGINHIFLYDNNEEEGLSSFLKEQLSSFYYSKIEIIPWREKSDFPQFDALYDVVDKHKYDVKWLLSIDIDEFLFLEEDIHQFLERYKNASLLYLSWESFNANGHLDYEDKPVLERFTKTFNCTDYGQGKIFFRPTRLNKWGIHSASLTKGKQVNVLSKELLFTPCVEKIYKYGWIKHYFTKSLQEWQWKIKRGCVDSLYCRRYLQFFEANPDLRDYYDPYFQKVQKHD